MIDTAKTIGINIVTKGGEQTVRMFDLLGQGISRCGSVATATNIGITKTSQALSQIGDISFRTSEEIDRMSRSAFNMADAFASNNPNLSNLTASQHSLMASTDKCILSNQKLIESYNHSTRVIRRSGTSAREASTLYTQTANAIAKIGDMSLQSVSGLNTLHNKLTQVKSLPKIAPFEFAPASFGISKMTAMVNPLNGLHNTLREIIPELRINTTNAHNLAQSFSYLKQTTDASNLSGRKYKDTLEHTTLVAKNLNNQMQRLATSTRHTSMMSTQATLQFQDMGVTAAMGMSPIMIGLQQGTQLAGTFQMANLGLADTLKALGSGFLKLFGPLSLFAIGLVTLSAYAIQCVSWTKLFSEALGYLGSALDFVADTITSLIPAITALTIVMGYRFLSSIKLSKARLKAFGHTIASVVIPSVKALWALMAANPFRIFLVSLTAVTGALLKFTNVFGWLNKQVKDFIGIDVGKNIDYYLVQPIKGASNALLGYTKTQEVVAETMEEKGKKILTVWEGINSGFSKWTTEARNVGSAMETYITGNLDKATQSLSNLLANLVVGTKKSFDGVMKELKKFGRALVAEMINIGTRLLASYAIRFLMGMFNYGSAQGIVSGLGKATAFATGATISSSPVSGSAFQFSRYQFPNIQTAVGANTRSSETTKVNITNQGDSPMALLSQVEYYDESGSKVINMVVSDIKDTTSRTRRAMSLITRV